MTLSEMLSYALTGESLPADPHEDVDQILEALASEGWDTQRIRSHAEQVLDGGGQWPHPISPEQMHAIGPARWYAILNQARADLDMDVDPQPPTNRTTLNADEIRLLHDVPPHFGTIG